MSLLKNKLFFSFMIFSFVLFVSGSIVIAAPRVKRQGANLTSEERAKRKAARDKRKADREKRVQEKAAHYKKS